MDSGIYKITCLANNKVYIGSSKNLALRKRTHFKNLKENQHQNSHLQSAYNLYGITNIYFEVIEYCFVDFLLEREQFWIDFYKAYDRNKGFNQLKKASRPNEQQGFKPYVFKPYVFKPYVFKPYVFKPYDPNK